MNQFFERETAPPTLPLLPGHPDLAGVVRLQEHLVCQGFKIWSDDNNAPGIDGDYGPGTQAGVAAFAAREKIPALVDLVFWERLVRPMRDAASFVPSAPALGPAVAQVAMAHVAQRPREARVMVNGVLRGFDNSGPWTRAYLAPFFSYPQPWCMGGVRAWILQALAANPAFKMPFAIDGPGILPLYVPSIVEQARKAGRFITGAGGVGVGPGSLMFLRHEGDHSHVGVVLADHGSELITAEANTSSDGSSNGWLVQQLKRPRWLLDFGAI